MARRRNEAWLMRLTCDALRHVRCVMRGNAIRWCAQTALTLAVLLSLPCPALRAAQIFILEAETMPVKTTGGPVTDGWNIWSNGYIEGTLTFPASGEYDLQTIARGSPASNGWPIMEIRIDGVTTATVVVAISAWTTYTIRRSIAGGSHRIAVAFTNDAYVPPEDRNLYVDKVTITSVSAPASDTTPPTVSLSAPASGATVSGTVTVSATASDNVGVVGVQFKLDGANLGAEDTTSPYSMSWGTTTATNASHTLTAVARDAAGNTTTAVNVTVTVNNPVPDTTPPIGSITINGGAAATNNPTVTLTLSATDNAGPVAQMRFSNDNTTYSTAEPYAASKTWTLTSGDGTKTVYAKFSDAAGNWSAVASDTIVLDTTPPALSFTSPVDGAVITAPGP